MQTIPPLRAGVTVEPLPDGRARLADALFAKRISLDPRGAQIVAALDRPQTLAALAERVGAEPEALRGILDRFAQHLLLATPEAVAAAAAAEATQAHAHGDAASLPLLIRADARFTCTQCGSCCGGHTIGPVQPDVIEGLTPLLDALAQRTGTEKGLFFTLPTQGAPTLACHTRGGSCVFLDADAKCVIHADYGAHMKPRACRLFPYQFVATPDGVAVSISQECRGFVEAGKGKPLRDDEAALRGLLALVPARAQVPARLRLDAETPLDWPSYRALEDELHGALADAAEPGVAWLELRARLVAAGAAVDVPAPACAPAALRADLQQLCALLGDFAEHVADALGEETADHVVRVESLHVAASALAGLAADWPRLVHPLGRADQRALFAASVHHELVDKVLLVEAPTVTGAFARMVFGWFLARAIAVDRARQVKRRHLVAQDLMDGIVTSRFVLRNETLGEAIEPLQPAIEGLFFARLPALLERAAELPPPDTRTEIYRF